MRSLTDGVDTDRWFNGLAWDLNDRHRLVTLGMLGVDDIEATVANLRERGLEVSDPKLGGDQSWQAWITDPDLRERTTRCWERAFELSPLEPADLERIPFTLKVPDCPVTFMAHKRAVVHVADEGPGRALEGLYRGAIDPAPTTRITKPRSLRRR